MLKGTIPEIQLRQDIFNNSQSALIMYPFKELKSTLTFSLFQVGTDHQHHDISILMERAIIETLEQELVVFRSPFYTHSIFLQMSFLALSTKLEYQTNYGMEQMTSSELVRDWISCYIRQNCPLIRGKCPTSLSTDHGGSWLGKFKPGQLFFSFHVVSSPYETSFV